ncbi:uncharacterized protein METZ01_LOCUS194279 [marine metagenome]|uniref:Uncharacterized protein n=1 Tax=marine metagenome TaxID=408172 RepID=A0A382DT45_9ZZZZ
MTLRQDLDDILDRLDMACLDERGASDEDRSMRLLHLGFILNEAKKRVSSILKETEAILINSDWDQSPYETQLFSIETKTGAPRKKWDHKTLANLVAKKITDKAIDMDTGEVLKTPQQMIQELLIYAAPSYWRVAALKELGIDPDDFCEVGEPLTNLIYRSNNNE